MPRTGRPKAELVLTDEERATLVRWSRRAKSSQALALRCRIVLACAEPGATNAAVAADLGVSRPTVGKWRSRFLQRRLEGLADRDRPGRPPSIGADRVEEVLVSTLEETPPGATHWSRRSMAERTGLSRSTVGRIWRRFHLRPHRDPPFNLSTDPVFMAKVVDVAGLYLNPPAGAVALVVHETARIPPGPPTAPGRPVPEHPRAGAAGLFAARTVADGATAGRRYRAADLKRFLARVDASVPAELDVHLIWDNHGAHHAPAITSWLDRHPRFRAHVTPTASAWVTQLDRWFGFLAEQMVPRGTPQSVQALEAGLSAWVAERDENPGPFTWAKTTDEIIESLGRFNQRTSGAGE
ncbi:MULTISPECIES: IS630 family transposase [Micromonospora]|uniref:IS630 family transposase n=1 Tax=Micromonospora TaxID=1873 RepID=UPI0021C9A8FB|nr:IS630 family transposase [Micromonospora sp. Mcm103]